MYASKIRYLASVFVDATSITATSRNIAGLADALDDAIFLPIVGQERNLEAVYRNRIGFMTENGEWQLLLASNRFDLTRLPTDTDGTNLGSFDTFCHEAFSKLTIALDYFKRRAHRLAAVQEGLLPETSTKEMEDTASRLFQLSPTYSKQLPFEWDWRAASRIERTMDELTEPTNTITVIKRLSGRVLGPKTEGEKLRATQSTFDRIRVDFDINTLPDNTIARFENRHIVSFFEQAGNWHADLSSEIFSFVLGRPADE